MFKNVLKDIFKIIICLFIIILNYTLTNAAQGDVWLSPNIQNKDIGEDFSVSLKMDIGSRDMDASVFEFDYDASKINLDTSKGNNGVDLGAATSSGTIVVNTNPPGSNKIRVVLSHSSLLTGNNKEILKIYFKPKPSFTSGTTTVFLKEDKSQVTVETLDGQGDFHNLALNNIGDSTIKVLIPATCDSSNVIRDISEINKFKVTCNGSVSTQKTRAIISYLGLEQESFTELGDTLNSSFYIPTMVTNYSANCYVSNKLTPAASDWVTSTACSNDISIPEVFNLKVEKFVDNVTLPADTPADAVEKNNDTNFEYKIRVKNEGPGKVTGITKIVDNGTILEGAGSGTIELLSGSGSNWSCNINSGKLECTTSKEVTSGQYFDIITVFAKTSVDAKGIFKNTSDVINFNEPDLYRTDNSNVAYVKSKPKDFNVSLKKYVDIEDLAHDAQDSSTSIYKSSDTEFEYIIIVKNNGPYDTFGVTKVIDDGVAGVNILSAVGANWTCNINSGKLVCTTAQIIHSGSNFSKITVRAKTGSSIGTFTNIATVSNVDEKNGETSDNSDPAVVKVLGPGGDCTNLSTAHKIGDPSNILIHCSANYANKIRVNIYEYDIMSSSFILKNTLQSLTPNLTYDTSYAIDLSKDYNFECLTEDESVVKNECFDNVGGYSCGNDVLEPLNNEECDLGPNNGGTGVLCDINCKIITPPGGSSGEITITALDWIKMGQGNNVFLNTFRDKVSLMNTSDEILNFGNSKLCIDNIIPNIPEYVSYNGQSAYVNITTPVCSSDVIGLLTPGNKVNINYSDLSNISGKNITDGSSNKIGYLNIYASNYKDTTLLSKLKYVEVIGPCSSGAGNILDDGYNCNLNSDLSSKAGNDLTNFIDGNYAGTVIGNNVSSVGAGSSTDDIIIKDKFIRSNNTIERNIGGITNSGSYTSITSGSDLLSSLVKSDSDSNVLISPNTLKINGDITLEPGIKTVIIKHGDLEINNNIKYSLSDKDSSYAFIVEDGDIIIKNTVEEIQGRFLLLNTAKKIKGTNDSFIPLVVTGSIYGNSSELKQSRLYNRGDNTYQALSTGLVINSDNRALPPKYKEHYNKYVQLKVNN